MTRGVVFGHSLTVTHISHKHQYLATASKNITPERKKKRKEMVEKYQPCVAAEQRGSEAEKRGPEPLSPLGFYRTLATERPVCSVVFAVEPLAPNTHARARTHIHTHTHSRTVKPLRTTFTSATYLSVQAVSVRLIMFRQTDAEIAAANKKKNKQKIATDSSLWCFITQRTA